MLKLKGSRTRDMYRISHRTFSYIIMGNHYVLFILRTYTCTKFESIKFKYKKPGEYSLNRIHSKWMNLFKIIKIPILAYAAIIGKSCLSVDNL